MRCALQALQNAKANDLLMWASRYNLFVLWSADRAHPWDSLDKANKAAATLEIGKMAGTKDEVRAFSHCLQTLLCRLCNIQSDAQMSLTAECAHECAGCHLAGWRAHQALRVRQQRPEDTVSLLLHLTRFARLPAFFDNNMMAA